MRRSATRPSMQSPHDGGSMTRAPMTKLVAAANMAGTKAGISWLGYSFNSGHKGFAGPQRRAGMTARSECGEVMHTVVGYPRAIRRKDEILIPMRNSGIGRRGPLRTYLGRMTDTSVSHRGLSWMS